MQNLDSDHLIKLFGISLPPDLAMILEFAPCGDLHKLLECHAVDKQLSWKYRSLVALDIAKGLAYLHSHLIIHRDVRRSIYNFCGFSDCVVQMSLCFHGTQTAK